MKGAIAWFAKNGVAANLLMLVVIVAGVFSMMTIKQETFPEFSIDMITVTVEYLGAAPEEVEEAVCVRVEEKIQAISGIEKISSTASEGRGTVTIELMTGADMRAVLDEVKAQGRHHQHISGRSRETGRSRDVEEKASDQPLGCR